VKVRFVAIGGNFPVVNDLEPGLPTPYIGNTKNMTSSKLRAGEAPTEAGLRIPFVNSCFLQWTPPLV